VSGTSRVNREVYARFCERLGVKFPGPTRRVRGKYYQRYREGTNIVLLDSDVAAVFRDSESVNQALRVLIKAASHLEVATPPKTEQT